MRDESWMERGDCRQVDPDVFYPDRGEKYADAKLICNGCPVVSQCLAFALDNMEPFGIGREGAWGGTTPNQRMALANRRRLVAA